MNFLPLSRVRSALGLERNVVAMLAMFLALGMGEELWTRFVPKYLELLGGRAPGFGVQAILKRVCMTLGPPLGGWFIARFGFPGGVRAGLVATLLLALVGIAVLRRSYVETAAPPPDRESLPGLWRRMD